MAAADLRRRRVFIAIGTALAMLLIIGCPIATILHDHRENVLFPSTGYPFPPASDIGKITLRGYFVAPQIKPVSFEVSPDDWDELLDALKPSESDWSPAKCQVLGDLDIQTKSGSQIYVGLYSTSTKLGAFSAGPTFETRKYYPGREFRKARARAGETQCQRPA